VAVIAAAGSGRARPSSLPTGGKPTPATAVATGYAHSCALTSNGGVRCWGLNDQGQLGDGTTANRSTPVDVSDLSSGVTAIAGGTFHTCALMRAGGVKCWGENRSGQLGDGTTTDRLTPVDVGGLSGVTAIAAGFHTCALLTTGGVKCWGENFGGQLGDGTTTDRSTPVDVVGLASGVAAIAIMDVHTCALTTGGGVKCWGTNGAGELGDGTTSGRSTPVDVVGLTSGVAGVGAGDFHSCALMRSRGVKCWGDNAFGELGDGTTTGRLTPVDVSGLRDGVKAIALGSGHTCALTTARGVKCWGYNLGGELGDGRTGNRSTPVDIPGLTSGVTAIAAGGEHGCGLTRTAGVKCWGDDYYGELGDGTSGNPPQTPVAVIGFGTPKATLAIGTHSVTVTPARVAAVTLRCGPQARCRGKLTLHASVAGKLVGSGARRVRVTLGSRSFAIGAGRAEAVKVTLATRGFRLLVHTRRLSAQARASYEQTPGVTVTATRVIALAAPSTRRSPQ
jgi:alpha-tubulin suppressor-like RCC1 family protein